MNGKRHVHTTTNHILFISLGSIRNYHPAPKTTHLTIQTIRKPDVVGRVDNENAAVAAAYDSAISHDMSLCVCCAVRLSALRDINEKVILVLP